MTPHENAAGALEHADASALAKARRNTAYYRFRYDVFISFSLGPPPRGAQSYASDLARRLRELDFAVFFSEEELVAGSNLTPSLRRGLERSKVLVVVLNRAVIRDPRWILDEVRWFRAKSPNGFICPISIDGALSDPNLAPDVAELFGSEPAIWVDETEQAWRDGAVSPEAFAKLVATPLRARANVTWRWITRGVIALLALTTAGAGWQAYEARAELRRSIASSLTSEAASMLAGTRDGTDERALQMLLAAWRLDEASPALAGMAAAMDMRSGLLRMRQTANSASIVQLDSPVDAVVLQDDANGISLFDLARLDRKSHLLIPNGLKAERYTSTADGRRHAVVNSDGSITIWEDRLNAMPLHRGGPDKPGLPYALLFNAAGDRLVVLDSMAGARLLDGATGIDVGALTGCHSMPPMVVAHDNTRRRVATGGPDQTVCVWDSVTGRNISAWKLGSWVRSLAFSPDGQILAVGRGGIFHEDASLDLLDAASGQPLGVRLGSGQQSPIGVSWCLDGKCLIVQDAINAYRVFQAPFQQEPLTFRNRVDPDHVSAISSDGRIVAYSSRDGLVRLWDLLQGVDLGEPLRGHWGGVHGIQFSTDGRRLLVFGKDGLLRLWSIGVSGPPEAKLLYDAQAVTRSLSVAAGKAAMAAGFEDRTIALWSAAGPPRVLQHTGKVIALSLSADGKLLAAAGDSFFSRNGFTAQWSEAGAVGVWNVNAQQPTPTFVIEPALGRLMDVTWRDKDTLVIVGEKGLSLHRSAGSAPTIEPLARSVDDTPRYRAARISPDGQLVAAALQDGAAVAIVDTNTGKEVSILNLASDSDGRHIVWMADSARLMTAGVNGTIESWSVRKGSRERKISVANESISALAVSGDGLWIAAGLSNGSVHLLKPDARVQVSIQVETGYDQVSELAVDQHANSIHSGSLSGVVRQFAGPGSWVEVLCSRISANMSRQFWSDHVSRTIGYEAQCPGMPESQH